MIFLDPVQYTHVADAQDPLNFPSGDPFYIELESFDNIVWVYGFAIFQNGKRIRAGFAFVALPPFDNAAFDKVHALAFDTKWLIHEPKVKKHLYKFSKTIPY